MTLAFAALRPACDGPCRSSNHSSLYRLMNAPMICRASSQRRELVEIQTLFFECAHPPFDDAVCTRVRRHNSATVGCRARPARRETVALCIEAPSPSAGPGPQQSVAHTGRASAVRPWRIGSRATQRSPRLATCQPTTSSAQWSIAPKNQHPALLAGPELRRIRAPEFVQLRRDDVPAMGPVAVHVAPTLRREQLRSPHQDGAPASCRPAGPAGAIAPELSDVLPCETDSRPRPRGSR